MGIKRRVMSIGRRGRGTTWGLPKVVKGAGRPREGFVVQSPLVGLRGFGAFAGGVQSFDVIREVAGDDGALEFE